VSSTLIEIRNFAILRLPKVSYLMQSYYRTVAPFKLLTVHKP
jgi:hypothetical protein